MVDSIAKYALKSNLFFSFDHNADCYVPQPFISHLDLDKLPAKL